MVRIKGLWPYFLAGLIFWIIVILGVEGCINKRYKGKLENKGSVEKLCDSYGMDYRAILEGKE